VFFQAAQECGKARAAAEGNNTVTAHKWFRTGSTLFHAEFVVAEPMLYYRKEFNTEHAENFEHTETAEKKKQDSLSPTKIR
jgi:hypothetical protein